MTPDFEHEGILERTVLLRAFITPRKVQSVSPRPFPCRICGRAGFTLIELVIVILVIGVLAGVSAPRIADYAKTAEKNAARESLRILREAVDQFRFQNGQWPGDAGTAADLKADLVPYLRAFPKNPIKEQDGVDVQTTGAALTTWVTGPYGWRYDNLSGQVILNQPGLGPDGTPMVEW